MKRANVAGSLIVVVLVAGPVFGLHAAKQDKRVACASNLRALWGSCFNYAAMYGRPNGIMQTEQGADFWLKLKRTPKPLIDKIEPFFCPLADHDMSIDQTSFRGPAANVNKMEDEDPVGADFDGNHGPKKGGNVLKKTGDVAPYTDDDPLWKACETKLTGKAPTKKQDPNVALAKQVELLEKTVKELTEIVKQLKEQVDRLEKARK